MKEINIDPITRLEGHGSVSIFLNDQGEVENAYLKVPELRGFEAFCVGRPAELMPIITTRICGVCPVAHHLCLGQGLGRGLQGGTAVGGEEAARAPVHGLHHLRPHACTSIIWAVLISSWDRMRRPEKRNILGVIEKAGLDVAKEVIKHRAYGQKITEIIGGKATHPVSGLPGGMSKPLSEESRASILEMSKSSVEFAQFTLQLFHQTWSWTTPCTWR